jgi:hypothetical protein
MENIAVNNHQSEKLSLCVISMCGSSKLIFTIWFQWAYYDYHMDKKKFLTKIFLNFFHLQNTLEFIKSVLSTYLKRK